MSIVTTSEVRAMGRIGGTVNESFLETIIAGAESYLAELMGVAFTNGSHTERHSGGFKQIWTNVQPISSVTRVYDRWTEDNVDSTIYETDGRSIYIIQGGYWEEGDRRYDVYYVGGWAVADVPAAVKLAIMQLAARMYDNYSGKNTQSAAGFGTDWESLMDSDIMRYIEPHMYRRDIG